MKKPDNIILEGITGSKAYGLDHADSDTDIKGIFVAKTTDVLSLEKHKETYDNKDPDWCYHEVEKFMKLAMKCNPTILEMLFLDGYLELTKHGKMLVDNRHIFLSKKASLSYGGYAMSQAKKLNAKDGKYGNGKNKRYAKHSRHLLRLMIQGKELLETGDITVRVTPEQRKEIFAFGELSPQQIIDRFTELDAEMKAINSVLPDEPDKEAINKILLKIRRGN